MCQGNKNSLANGLYHMDLFLASPFGMLYGEAHYLLYFEGASIRLP